MTVKKSSMSIKECIQNLAGAQKPSTMMVRVEKVDKQNLSCDVLEEAAELLYPGIRLKSVETTAKQTAVFFPEVGSYVLMERVEMTDDWFITRVDTVQEIWLGGDKFTTVKADEL